tara:strand:+ start:146237 stop:147334 length:1098 start_codon:yes stop_codon:yes gene_type:complete
LTKITNTLEDSKRFIKNSVCHQKSKDFGMVEFYKVYKKLDVEFIDYVYQSAKVNFLVKEHYNKLGLEAHSSYLDFLKHFLSKMNKEKTLFSNDYKLTIKEDTYNQSLSSLISYFDNELNREILKDISSLYLESIFNSLKVLTFEDLNEKKQKLFVSIVSNFYEFINDKNKDFISEDIINKFETFIVDFAKKEPVFTLSVAPLSNNILNSKHVEILDKLKNEESFEKDSCFLTIKNITAKKLNVFDINMLLKHKGFNKIFEFRVKNRDIFNSIPKDILKEYNINYDSVIISAKDSIAKNQINSRYTTFDFLFNKFDKETINRMLHRINVSSITNERSFVKECISVCDNFGYITEEQFEQIELLYVS